MRASFIDKSEIVSPDLISQLFLPRNQQLIPYLLIFSYELFLIFITDFEIYLWAILLVSNNLIFVGLFDFGLTFS